MPAGRPSREFTPEQRQEIADLARQGCQTLTISRITGIPDQTLRDNFREVMQKERALRKLDVLKAQNSLLQEGNNTMAIWLGKQELNQKDKQEVEQNTNLKLYGVEAPIDEV